MNRSGTSAFRAVTQADYLGFWADQRLNARKVADLLDLGNRTFTKVVAVAPLARFVGAGQMIGRSTEQTRFS